ncbi:hypothetical protein HMPREF3224_01298 [Anaerococcus hydrogenalis]|nr:hypothetical protein HMPREF3224_01298 [Anaerococcus hydrogenalis]
MKSLKSKIVASTLALCLVGGAVIANPQKAEAAGKPLNIKKVLNLPAEGVTTPKETFTFTFAGHSKNGDKTKATEVPAVNDVTIAYATTDSKDNDATKNGKQLIKESADALAGVQWSESGQFTYTVTETAGSTKDMTYSKASYLVSVFVGKTDDGTGYEVKDIQIKKLTDDKGEKATDTKQEYKPGEGDDKTGNNFAFENNYDKKDGNDAPGGGTDITPDDKKGFALRKTVEDASNDEFKFKLTVEKPVGSNSSDDTFTYKIVNKEGTAGAEQTLTYGTAKEDIVLKHNERLVFGKVLLGSEVSVEETDSGKYNGEVSSSSFNGTTIKVNKGIIGDQAGGNFIEFLNKKQTATGLLIENLPFLALILVAGLGIFFFVKNRKEDEALA